MMQTTNENSNSGTAAPGWRFLGKYPLNEIMVEKDNRDRTHTGLLFEAIRDMGIHSELISDMESRLIGFVKEAMAHLNQEKTVSPVYIRLFCKIQTEENVNSTEYSSQLNTKQTLEHNQMAHQFDSEINAGWGYFLIEKGGGIPPGSSVSASHWIDFYLYKEGE